MTSRNRIATRDQSKYPSLWRTCEGAWNPGLGPTGDTLRDWSGRHNHAPIVNSPQFVPWQGSYTLKFISATETVRFNSIPLIGTGGFTFSLFFTPTDLSGVDVYFGNGSLLL